MKKKQSLFGDILASVTKYFLILVGAVLLLVLASGIKTVQSGKVAVVLRFGKLVGDTYEEQVHEPGLFFAFPYIIDEVITVPTGSVFEQSVDTYYTDGKVLDAETGGYLITGDSNVAVVSASVKYTISDPVAYALHVQDVSSVINATVSNSMLTQAAGTDVDDLLTNGKEAFAKAVMARAQAKLDTVGVGVKIGALELTRVSMPKEVKSVYDEVTAATVRAATIAEEAAQYRDKLLPLAQGDKATAIAAAQSAKSMAVANANTDLVEFWGFYKELGGDLDTKEPIEIKDRRKFELITSRIFTEKVSTAISKIGKIIVTEDGDNKIFLDP